MECLLGKDEYNKEETSLMAKLSMIVKNVRKKGTIQYRNRCNICGRPRGFIRMFGLCRICFRTLAGNGMLPGIRKSSW